MAAIDPQIASEICRQLDIDIPREKTMEELEGLLSKHVNYLISQDPEKLMRVLYKVDVSEKLLKAGLINSKEDPGLVIARMIIERQLEKMKAKAQSKRDEDIPENEKW